jgi:hypothetical protein
MSIDLKMILERDNLKRKKQTIHDEAFTFWRSGQFKAFKMINFTAVFEIAHY